MKVTDKNTNTKTEKYILTVIQTILQSENGLIEKINTKTIELSGHRHFFYSLIIAGFSVTKDISPPQKKP